MPLEQGEPIPVVIDAGAASQGTAPGMSPEERQAIYKAIFDLKQKVDALEARLERRSLPAPSGLEARQDAEWQGQDEGPSGRLVDIEPDEQPQEERNLSWRHTEDDLIRKALEKHHGNRKLAAEELGMSERTLYRKLPPEYRKK